MACPTVQLISGHYTRICQLPIKLDVRAGRHGAYGRRARGSGFLVAEIAGHSARPASVVDARDVAGAAERGRPGERYIVAGRAATLREIVQALDRVSAFRRRACA